jgi:hypothetical protein
MYDSYDKKSKKGEFDMADILRINSVSIWESFFNDLVGKLYKIKSFRILEWEVNKEFSRFVEMHPLVQYFGAEFMYNTIKEKHSL